MKIQTDQLIGPALDWAAAYAQGLPLKLDPMGFRKGAPNSIQAGWWVWDDETSLIVGPAKTDQSRPDDNYFSPSTYWSQGGPMLDELIRRGLWIKGSKCRYVTDATHVCVDVNGHYMSAGSSILDAGVRCFIKLRVGDEVDIPEELIKVKLT